VHVRACVRAYVYLRLLPRRSSQSQFPAKRELCVIETKQKMVDHNNSTGFNVDQHCGRLHMYASAWPALGLLANQRRLRDDPLDTRYSGTPPPTRVLCMVFVLRPRRRNPFVTIESLSVLPLLFFSLLCSDLVRFALFGGRLLLPPCPSYFDSSRWINTRTVGLSHLEPPIVVLLGDFDQSLHCMS